MDTKNKKKMVNYFLGKTIRNKDWMEYNKLFIDLILIGEHFFLLKSYSIFKFRM